jgi:hypothetical protein
VSESRRLLGMVKRFNKKHSRGNTFIGHGPLCIIKANNLSIFRLKEGTLTDECSMTIGNTPTSVGKYCYRRKLHSRTRNKTLMLQY